MTQYLLAFVQLLAAVATTASAYAAYRSRDNQRAAELAEMKADIRLLLKRMDGAEESLRLALTDCLEQKRGIA